MTTVLYHLFKFIFFFEKKIEMKDVLPCRKVFLKHSAKMKLIYIKP